MSAMRPVGSRTHTELLGGQVSVTRRPDGRWRARYRDVTGREHAKHFTRKVDAERWVTANKSQRDRGDWIDPTLARVTVSVVAGTWLKGRKLNQAASVLRESLAHCRPTSVGNGPHQHHHVHAGSHLGGRTAAPVFSSRTSQALLVLKQVLDIAVLDGRLSRNMAKRVRAPGRTRQSSDTSATPSCKNGRRLRRRTPPLPSAHLDARIHRTSLGRTARALRIRHVDPDLAQVIVIDNIPVGYNERDTVKPKSNRARVVPMPRIVADEVNRLVQDRSPDDLLFTSPSGGLLNNSNFRRDVFNPAVEACRILH